MTVWPVLTPLLYESFPWSLWKVNQSNIKYIWRFESLKFLSGPSFLASICTAYMGVSEPSVLIQSTDSMIEDANCMHKCL